MEPDEPYTTTQKKVPPPRQAYKLTEAADLLGVSVVTLRRAIQRGLLTPIRAFRHVLLSQVEIDRFIANSSGRRGK